jgi:methionyl aminopeptidase
MIVLCQEALDAAVKSVQVGKRIGIIGNTIFNKVKNSPFGLIVGYGGHGLDYNTPHCAPFVENKSRADDGVRIVPGMAIAIEPMLVLSKNFKTKVLKDNWSVITKHLGCHFEHSITLDQSGNVHVITEHLMNAKDFL